MWNKISTKEEAVPVWTSCFHTELCPVMSEELHDYSIKCSLYCKTTASALVVKYQCHSCLIVVPSYLLNIPVTCKDVGVAHPAVCTLSSTLYTSLSQTLSSV